MRGPEERSKGDGEGSAKTGHSQDLGSPDSQPRASLSGFASSPAIRTANKVFPSVEEIGSFFCC